MKHIIRWNAGYGDSYRVVESPTEDGACNIAYEEWREEAENNADYDVEKYTEEAAKELDIE